MRWFFALALCCGFAAPGAAQAAGWAGFYDRARLEQTRADMVPGIEENLREVILPKLSSAERAALAGVRLEFPLEHDASPMNFWAYAGSGRVVLPVSSLRFLADVCLAYALLNAKGQSQVGVAEYVAALKYRGPGAFPAPSRQPLQALGLVAQGQGDARVQRDMQRLFGTAVVFILGHELGHVLHRHGLAEGPLAAEAAQAQERQADAFALELLRRIGDAPVGTLPVFTIFAHLGSFASDPGHEVLRAKATHPSSGARLQAAAEQLVRAAPDYARTGTPPAVLRQLGGELGKVGQLLDDPGLQALMRSRGQSVTLHSLRPDAQAPPPAVGEPFAGRYVGRWLDAKGEHFDVTLTLRRQGALVRGEYSFGAGSAQIEGLVEGGRLHYKWRWGSDYFGRGVLELQADGHSLTGTWGTTQASAGGGAWQLQRAR